MNEKLTWVECPRDAMQGIQRFIDTHQKIEYINQLIAVGFDTIDIGSFVSPKAIPQMRDKSVYKEKRGKHSKKPEYFRNWIDRCFPSATKIELFARQHTPGWDAWGNEVESDIVL